MFCVYKNQCTLTSSAMLSRWAGRPSERELSEPLVLGKIRKKTQKELSDKEAEALNQGVTVSVAKQTLARRAKVPWQRESRTLGYTVYSPRDLGSPEGISIFISSELILIPRSQDSASYSGKSAECINR